jgi:hypothetical protein
MSLLSWGGRWFAAGARADSNAKVTKPILAEIDFSQAKPRFIELISSGAPNPGGGPTVYYQAHVGLVQTGSALSVAFGDMGDDSSDLDAQFQQQNPPDGEHAVAVSYTVGCP